MIRLNVILPISELRWKWIACKVIRKTIKGMARHDGIIILILFTLSVYLYYLVAAWGISDYLAASAFKDYVTGPGVQWEASIFSLSFGLFLTVVNAWSDAPRLRRLPFAFIILLKSLLYLVSSAFAWACVLLAFRLFLFSTAELKSILGLVTPRFFISSSIWFTTSILAINFIMEVRRKVGPGNFSALFTGYYRRPRIEERIFLFLDLKSSTTIAERLGPEKYSRLLRQCFYDLNDVVLTYRAQIYQFVGDEVVLTWRNRDPGSPSRSLRVFFDFKEKLRNRKALYEKKYGVVPIFRGGIDMGAVTATEVGDIKREIAYHGDPINTAARLLELSKDYGHMLVISGKTKTEISSSEEFTIEHRGEVKLRGKTEKVTIYTVSHGEL
jgi:adenylate cyclase